MSRRCSSAPPTASTISPARCAAPRKAARPPSAASATLVERLAALAESDARPADAARPHGRAVDRVALGDQPARLSAARPTTTARRWPPTSAPSRAISAGWSRRTRAAGRRSATNCGSWSSASADRSSDEEREALLAHQRAIEGHLARLVDENVRSRTALADELRGEFRLLARTFASTARGAVHPPGDGQAMASASRRRGGAADYIWPGYVDALTTLLMVLIFLLSLFSVAQFTLSDCAQQPRQRHRPAQPADRRSRQPAVDREARPARACRRISSSSPCSSRQMRSRARQAIGGELAAERRLVGCAQDRARPAHRAPDLDAGRARQARRRRAKRRQGVRGQGRRPAEGDRAPAAGADAPGRLAGRRQQREGQALHRPHRGAEARGRAEGRAWCA